MTVIKIRSFAICFADNFKRPELKGKREAQVGKRRNE